METRLLFVHALSPLHAGTGQGVGVIDLPIAREKATDIPFLPGSSLKGVLRDVCQTSTNYKSLTEKIFGPATSNASEYAGSVQFSDQRLLLLPIRSLAGTFAWVTSPYLLRRFLRDTQDVNITDVPKTIPQLAKRDAAVIQQGCALIASWNTQQRILLEDLDLQPKLNDDATKWAGWLSEKIFSNEKDWQDMLKARFCVVHDDMFSFLLQTATEITARIKLKDDTKTVEKGGLWYEESLPTETILSGLVMATSFKATVDQVFDTVGKLTTKTLQFGGNATVGRGLCHVQMTPL